MRKSLSIFALALALYSCSEEVSRDINTDLPQEADQFFSLTKTIGESAYLANISRTEYDSIVSEQLPGCPVISFSEDSTRIILDYTSALDCEEENKVVRSGKIILNFQRSGATVPAWSMTYEDYHYGSVKLSGQRLFTTAAWNENQEVFENLEVELPNNVGFSVSGTSSYSVTRSSSGPSTLAIRGKIEGANPAGRSFTIVTSSPKTLSFPCYGYGWDLALSGAESWTVAREGTSELSYQVSFQNTDTCNPTVTAKLPDGRALQLNP